MKKNNIYQKKLQEILDNSSFEELEPFKGIHTWKLLNEKDRDLLGLLFVLRGEKELGLGEDKAMESLDLALKVAPNNSAILYRVGCAYATQQSSYTSLKLSESIFRKAISLNENLAMTWVTLGNVYITLGNLKCESKYFYQADQCFGRVSECSEYNAIEDSRNLYWYWGLSWYFLAKHSGEAGDYLEAVNKFRKGALAGVKEKFFWSAYGEVLAELAVLLNKSDLFLEVAELHRNSLREDFDYFEGWLNLALTYQRLFEESYGDEYFSQANECFKLAAQLSDATSFLWFKWGELQLTEAQQKHDLQLLRESLGKFQKAEELKHSQPGVLILWAQALLLYGSNAEDLEAIHRAQDKLLKALAIDPDSSTAWYYYGISWIELGRYFKDLDFFLEAINKFQYSLTIKKNDPMLLYGSALANYAVGDLDADPLWIEKSVALFSKSYEQEKERSYQFWNDWGIAFMKLAELTNEKSYFEEALDKFEYAFGQDLDQIPDNMLDPDWLYNYGTALDFFGDCTEDIEFYEKAIQVLSRALQIDPENSHARYSIALVYSHLGETARDIECFHKSIENFQILLSQNHEDAQGWNEYGVTLIHLAQLIRDESHPDQPFKIYEIAESKLLQATGLGNVQSYYNLTCLYSLMGNLSMSMHFLERAEGAQALPPIDEMMQDEWLENLRSINTFHEFISNFRKNQISEDL
jgi:tetratricopeptide (TPR) repeat protein